MEIPGHRDVNTKLVSKVFVLYTGGTIGMTRNSDDVLVPAKNKLENNLRALGTFHDKEFATKTLCNDDMLVLPMIANVKRIAYSIYEWDDLMDSSNMTSSLMLPTTSEYSLLKSKEWPLLRTAGFLLLIPITESLKN